MKQSNASAGRRLARFAVPAAVLWFGAQGAWAADTGCKMNPNYKEKVIDMVMGTILVPNDAVVGQKLGERDFPLTNSGGSNQPWICATSDTVHGVMLQGQDMNFPGLPKMYSTNVQGIGIRLLRTISSTSKNYYPHDLTGSFGPFDPAAAFRVEVYKTAATTGSGPLAQGTYTQYYSNSDPRSVLTTFLSANAITIITPSCTVDVGSRNISVQFGKVPQSAFKGKGSTTAERNFNIKLNCKAGVGMANQVYLRMDATKDPGGDDGVLRLTQDGQGVATGVGIQVIDDKKVPVKYGEAAFVGPSKDGDYVLPFTARYFQTGNAVTPGRANGTANFTIDYK
ncbi:fimbrial protein [Variovorax sp. EL159]|uniref:fimbrial protein n=1 Tax=Variovorax sp. EL159 TaxID=1566270 RepID=UPI00088A7136|nr:fimbrial protein [Variovorax sp. EL159]SCX74592.1 Pilin (type 1 fimbria component protein) [Variovorax sp. EL159]